LLAVYPLLESILRAYLPNFQRNSSILPKDFWDKNYKGYLFALGSLYNFRCQRFAKIEPKSYLISNPQLVVYEGF